MEREMKGMKSNEFAMVQDFVQKYHKFARCASDAEHAEAQKLYPKMDEYGKNIKYIDSVYDTRFADVWSVSFRGMGHNVNFNTNTELNLPFESLFDWIKAYLTYEWVPTEEELKAITVNR